MVVVVVLQNKRGKKASRLAIFSNKNASSGATTGVKEPNQKKKNVSRRKTRLDMFMVVFVGKKNELGTKKPVRVEVIYFFSWDSRVSQLSFFWYIS